MENFSESSVYVKKSFLPEFSFAKKTMCSNCFVRSNQAKYKVNATNHRSKRE